jgi:hypothetical protein
MIAGHFGFAAAVKAQERQAPLWALMLATVWLDIVFVPLFLAKIETLSVAPGTIGGYGSAIIHADYTHAVLGAIVLSVLFGAVAQMRWGRRTGVVLAAVVFSHWVLDLVVHRPDLPILPGNAGHLPEFGFGLWEHPVAAMTIELLIVVIGAALYWRAARATVTASGVPKRGRANVAGFLVLACGLAVLALDFSRIAD